ncbi:hypothetical protein ACP70R_033559 [Stipagrostis hirtigluma subsp. patula]
MRRRLWGSSRRRLSTSRRRMRRRLWGSRRRRLSTSSRRCLSASRRRRLRPSRRHRHLSPSRCSPPFPATNSTPVIPLIILTLLPHMLPQLMRMLGTSMYKHVQVHPPLLCELGNSFGENTPRPTQSVSNGSSPQWINDGRGTIPSLHLFHNEQRGVDPHPPGGFTNSFGENTPCPTQAVSNGSSPQSTNVGRGTVPIVHPSHNVQRGVDPHPPRGFPNSFGGNTPCPTQAASNGSSPQSINVGYGTIHNVQRGVDPRPPGGFTNSFGENTPCPTQAVSNGSSPQSTNVGCGTVPIVHPSHNVQRGVGPHPSSWFRNSFGGNIPCPTQAASNGSLPQSINVGYGIVHNVQRGLGVDPHTRSGFPNSFGGTPCPTQPVSNGSSSQSTNVGRGTVAIVHPSHNMQRGVDPHPPSGFPNSFRENTPCPTQAASNGSSPQSINAGYGTVYNVQRGVDPHPPGGFTNSFGENTLCPTQAVSNGSSPQSTNVGRGTAPIVHPSHNVQRDVEPHPPSGFPNSFGGNTPCPTQAASNTSSPQSINAGTGTVHNVQRGVDPHPPGRFTNSFGENTSCPTQAVSNGSSPQSTNVGRGTASIVHPSHNVQRGVEPHPPSGFPNSFGGNTPCPTQAASNTSSPQSINAGTGTVHNVQRGVDPHPPGRFTNSFGENTSCPTQAVSNGSSPQSTNVGRGTAPIVHPSHNVQRRVDPHPVYNSFPKDTPSHAQAVSNGSSSLQMNVGDDTNGSDRDRTERRLFWTTEEDLRLVSAWLRESNDPKESNYKKNDQYWAAVAIVCNNQTPQNRKREVKQIKDRFGRIKKRVAWFCGSWKKASASKASGESDVDLMDKALKIYAEEHPTEGPFMFKECWDVLHKEPKWDAYLKHLEGLGPPIKTESNVEEDVGKHFSLDDAGDERPIGGKQAKEQHKRKRMEQDSVIDLDDKLSAQNTVNEARKEMLETQGHVCSEILEAQKLAYLAAKERKKQAVLEAYKSLITQDTTVMSDDERFERMMALRLFREELLPELPAKKSYFQS